LAAINEGYDEFQEYGAEVVAVSVDTPEQSAKLAARNRLRFPLLSDEYREVITEWNGINRQERGGIAFPSAWVIDSELFVEYRALERKASRVDLAPVLRFLAGEIGHDEAVQPRRVMPDIGASVRYPAQLVGYLFRRTRR